VFDGNHRLVGERGDKLDLFRAERLRPGLGDKDHADDLAVAQQGSAQCGAVVSDLLRLIPGILGVCQYVRNMYYACFNCASTRDAASSNRHFPAQEKLPDTRVYSRAVAKAGFEPQEIAIALEQPGMVCFAKVRGGFHEGIEHGLQVEGRTADYLEHVGGGGLL